MSKQNNNFQDQFAEREYQKGKNAGKRGNARKTNRGKGTKPNNQGKGRWSSTGSLAKPGVPIETGSTDNDWQWYVPTAQMLKDVASLPFGRMTGLPYLTQVQSQTQPSNVKVADNISMPGIFTYYLMPTFGTNTDQTGPLNVASNALYISTRRATSGTSYYMQNNEMLYVLAIGNAYSFYSWITRLYGLACNMSWENKYTPEALVEANGVIYSDIRNNLADFRAWINQFEFMLERFVIPKDLTYITRQVFVYENVYTDANTQKAQYYMYAPAGFYFFREGVEESAVGSLIFKPCPVIDPNATATNNMFTLQALMEYGDAMLKPIINSEQFLHVMADIAKAFGDNGMFRLAQIAETYSVHPVYNPEVLTQFENAYIYDGTVAAGSVDQVTILNNSYLATQAYVMPDMQTTGIIEPFMQRDEIILNFHHNSPTPEEIIVATRLTGNGLQPLTAIDWTKFGYPKGMDGLGAEPRHFASEIVVQARIYYYDQHSIAGHLEYKLDYARVATRNTLLWTPEQNVLMSDLSSKISRATRTMALVSRFDWHPPIYFISGYGTDQSSWTIINVSDVFQDIEVSSRISGDNIDQMNAMALLAMLNQQNSSLFDKASHTNR